MTATERSTKRIPATGEGVLIRKPADRPIINRLVSSTSSLGSFAFDRGEEFNSVDFYRLRTNRFRSGNKRAKPPTDAALTSITTYREMRTAREKKAGVGELDLGPLRPTRVQSSSEQ